MATKIERRGVTLFIDGKEIKNDVKSIEREFYKLRGELKKSEIGSEEYNQKLQQMGQLKNILDSHNKAVKETAKSWGGLNNGVLGKLQNSFADLPGPIGMAVTSVTTLGKAMWALVANPIGATIAAIVGALTLLYKAFTSTDTGAVAMEGTLKGIGNILDVLLDRTMSYFKLLGSIITFDWQGIKNNAKDAFGGIAGSIRDTASAGWEYAQTMDGIADREAAAQIRMEKMKAEIETLKNLSKDSNKTAEEKLELAKKAMDLEVELNGIEKGFLIERNQAETKNLASKIQIGNITMKQKEEMLKQWLAVDDKELESLMEKDKAFADFVNKNEEEFQTLQKAKASEFLKDQEFQKETRRLQKTLSSEKKEILQEEEQNRKQHFENLKDSVDKAFQEEQNILKQQFLDKKVTQEQLNLEMQSLEMAHLVAMKALHEKYGLDVTEINTKILDQQINAQAEANKRLEEMLKVSSEVKKNSDAEDVAAASDLERQMDEEFKKYQTSRDKEAQEEIDRNLEKQEAAQALKDVQIETAVQSGIAAIENAQTMEEAGKAVLNSIREQLKAYIAEAVTIAALKALKSVPFPFNMIAATVAGGAATFLFNKMIPKFATGGYTQGAEMYVAGEKGTEWIAPNWMTKNPATGPLINSLERMRQRNIVPSEDTVKYFANGGYTSKSTSISGDNLPDFNSSNNSSIAPLLAATAKALDENAKATRQFMKWKPKVYTEMIKKDLAMLEDIERKRGL